MIDKLSFKYYIQPFLACEFEDIDFKKVMQAKLFTSYSNTNMHNQRIF